MELRRFFRVRGLYGVYHFRAYGAYAFPWFPQGNRIHHSSFPKGMVYTIALIALRPGGGATDQEGRGATVVVCTLFLASGNGGLFEGSDGLSSGGSQIQIGMSSSRALRGLSSGGSHGLLIGIDPLGFSHSICFLLVWMSATVWASISRCIGLVALQK